MKVGLLKSVKHAMNVARSAIHEAHKSVNRSPHWVKTEHEHLRTNPTCAACTGTDHVQVHHVQPFHLHPELELDPTNLMTLCMGPKECHLQLGHGGDFRKYNPLVRTSVTAARANGAEWDAIVNHAHTVAVR